MATVFENLVRALEPALRSVAPFTAARLLLRARVFDRDHMTTADLARARPQLVDGLAEILSPGDLQGVMQRIDGLLPQPGVRTPESPSDRKP